MVISVSLFSSDVEVCNFRRVFFGNCCMLEGCKWEFGGTEDS